MPLQGSSLKLEGCNLEGDFPKLAALILVRPRDLLAQRKDSISLPYES
jgi:hypothetical protein